jgi:hypothetical protein
MNLRIKSPMRERMETPMFFPAMLRLPEGTSIVRSISFGERRVI